MPTGQEVAQQALEERDQERLQRQQLVEKWRSLSPEQLAALGISASEHLHLEERR